MRKALYTWEEHGKGSPPSHRALHSPFPRWSEPTDARGVLIFPNIVPEIFLGVSLGKYKKKDA